MFSKSKNKQILNTQTREQYDYARKRINQKKRLMYHFVLFLAASILFIILDKFLKVGHQVLMKGWYAWAIIFWTFTLLIHLLNVFIINTFMGEEWEDQQLEKLKNLQEERILELRTQANQEIKTKETIIKKDLDGITQIKNETNPNILPPENL
tara:strand:- start:812 stop:1270 length:459 start_codon:yes stop_codon:yes gene_type:complete